MSIGNNVCFYFLIILNKFTYRSQPGNSKRGEPRCNEQKFRCANDHNKTQCLVTANPVLCWHDNFKYTGLRYEDCVVASPAIKCVVIGVVNIILFL